MSFGGFHPHPRRFGQGRPFLRVVHDALAAARGTAIDALTPGTVAYVETHAYARALVFDGYGTNERLGNQCDPRRVTDMLSRWEKITGLLPIPTATLHDRRVAVLRRMRRFLHAAAFHSRLHTVLLQELGDFFVAIEYIDINNAVVHVPDVAYPWGTVLDGAPWTSTVYKILVLTQRPVGASESEFYERISKIGPGIDNLLPGPNLFDWYRAPHGGAPVEVSGGPSQAGFYLDDEHNLDNNVFDG
jgi:hypothetical protein